MEKTNRILIGAVFILVIALVSFNYSNITGNVIESKTKISITPEVINSGQKIYVTVNPGSKGIHNKACFYQAEDDLRRGCTYDRQICNSYKCEEISTFSFSTSGWESGIHYVKIFDYDKKDYAKAYFTIT